MSNKCKLVDQNTFDLLQQSTSQPLSSVHKVRNAKYKRMTTKTGFDLLMYLNAKFPTERQNKGKNRRIKRKEAAFKKTEIQKKGKQRENAKLARTRLKKAILRYRQKKSLNGNELPLEETTEKLNDMSVTDIEDSHIKELIHSRKFREYCNTITTPQLQKYAEELLRELNRFQRRAYAQNEIKARAHKRLVIGFRQVQSYLSTNKVKLVIIATDCEKCTGEEAGLEDTIATTKSLCRDQNVPIAFPFQRRHLAYILYKKASISCVGILDYDGARETFSHLLLAIEQAKESYEEKKRITSTFFES